MYRRPKMGRLASKRCGWHHFTAKGRQQTAGAKSPKGRWWWAP